MSQAASTLIDIVSRRTRDPNLIGNTRAFVRSIISRSQQMVNAHLRLVFDTASLTTLRRTMLYPIQANLPDAVRIDEVLFDTDFRLNKSPWGSLIRSDWNWHRSIGTSLMAFSTIGRDLLLLYPGLDNDNSVTVNYVTLTSVLTQESTPTEIPDADLTHVLNLSETILLLKSRKLDLAEVSLKKVEAFVQ